MVARPELSMLVCIPARREEPETLWQQPVQAFTANDALYATLDYTPDMDEEAERGALMLASVWGLARFGERFVVTAEVGQAQVTAGEEAHNGGVQVTGLRRDQLVAFFTDPDEDPKVAAAVAHGLTLDEAWELPQVQDLLGNDLQWHDLGEWGR